MNKRFNSHSPLDTEEPPPPIPPKQFSVDDNLLLPNLPESSEPLQIEVDAPLPYPSKTNQENTNLPSHPAKTHQKTTVSGQSFSLDLYPPQPRTQDSGFLVKLQWVQRLNQEKIYIVNNLSAIGLQCCIMLDSWSINFI